MVLAFVAGAVSLYLLLHVLSPKSVRLKLSGSDQQNHAFTVLIDKSGTKWTCSTNHIPVIRGLVIYPDNSSASDVRVHFRYFWGDSDEPAVVDSMLPVGDDEFSAKEVSIGGGLNASAFH
jgi:hypothetical protein